MRSDPMSTTHLLLDDDGQVWLRVKVWEPCDDPDATDVDEWSAELVPIGLIEDDPASNVLGHWSGLEDEVATLLDYYHSWEDRNAMEREWNLDYQAACGF